MELCLGLGNIACWKHDYVSCASNPFAWRAIAFFVFLFLGWLFKYRKPADILVSTYVTFSKVRRGNLLEERLSRTEPLVIEGPYRYVRHPLYFGVVVIVIGWWLILDYGFLLVSAFLLLLWFNFVVARFEEEELRAMFGERYQEYAKEVPGIIPFIKRGKK